MFANLKYAMLIKKITNKDLASALNLSERTITNKINGATDWTYLEVIKIKKLLFPEYDTDWLFIQGA